VGVAGMALVGAACLLLTRVSVNGSYWPDLFFGMLVFGAGLGSAFVASQIAALTGAAERESGLAAGLADSSFNIGSALGIAILSTVCRGASGPGSRVARDDRGLPGGLRRCGRHCHAGRLAGLAPVPAAGTDRQQRCRARSGARGGAAEWPAGVENAIPRRE
jgi:hypothetical protein